MNAPTDPRISILIHNENSGRAGSFNGDVDLLDHLLRSLQRTLADEPTAFEIIAYDDGSTDDSRDTLRRWSRRTWRDNQPMLKLIEAAHSGVPAVGFNELGRAAAGQVLVWLPGDAVCLTENWASRVCERFDRGARRLGVLGGKQMGADGRIVSYGDWVLHPAGHHHIGAGLDRYAVRYPMEVDYASDGFYCCRKQVFEELGGYDQDLTEGEAVDFGLRARRAGWACMVVPHLEFASMRSLRARRRARPDDTRASAEAREQFRDKWGFDRLAPDLDIVRQRYANTPLLWNSEWFGVAAGVSADREKRPDVRLQFDRGDWGRYATDSDFARMTERRIAMTLDMIRRTGPAETIVQIGCGVGLVTHLLAQRGLNCIGLEALASNIEFAHKQTANQIYPGPRPQFEQMADGRRLPIDDGRADLVLIYDQLETHSNPSALLREAHRVLRPAAAIKATSAKPGGGRLIVIPNRSTLQGADPSDPDRPIETDQHPYLDYQLAGMIEAAGGSDGWTMHVDPRDNVTQSENLIAVAERKHQQAAAPAIAPDRQAAPAA